MTETAPQKRTPAKATTPAAAQQDSTPSAQPEQTGTTGPVGTPEVIDAQEHVLGDDPRRVEAQTKGGYHDSLTGRPIDENGHFTDTKIKGGEGPVPSHRIVANDWPDRAREEHAEAVERVEE